MNIGGTKVGANDKNGEKDKNLNCNVQSIDFRLSIVDNIDCVISATKSGNSLTAKTLDIFENNSQLSKYFANLKNYKGIVIVDDESHEVWCHEKIIQLNNVFQVPFFLIQVPVYWMDNKQTMIQYLKQLIQENKNDKFFQTLILFMTLYCNLSHKTRFKMTYLPYNIKDATTRFDFTRNKCFNVRIPWWEIESKLS